MVVVGISALSEETKHDELQSQNALDIAISLIDSNISNDNFSKQNIIL